MPPSPSKNAFGVPTSVGFGDLPGLGFRLKAVLQTLLLFMLAILQLSAQDLLFHAPFEDSLAAKTASGNADPPTKKGTFTFEKGSFGNGLKVGAAESFLLYSAEKNVRGDEGTVAFWLQPDWSPNDDKFHMFWTFLGNGMFNLYKFGGGDNKLIFLVSGRGQSRDQFVTVSTSISKWKAGEPHHLAATWTAGVVQLFVDGEKAGELSDPKLLLPEAREGYVFFIGDYDHPGYGTQRGMSGKADTLIRDFRIYSKALTADQIAELAGVKKK